MSYPVLNRLVWLTVTVFPAGSKVLILSLLGVLSIPSGEIAELLNIASLVGVFATASIGIALSQKKEEVNLNGIFLLIVIISIVAILQGMYGLYVLIFVVHQVYRFIALANKEPYQVFISDMVFLVLNIYYFIAMGSLGIIWQVLLFLLVKIVFLLKITKYIKKLNFRVSSICETQYGYFYSGISNLSTSGLIFAIPIILAMKLDGKWISEVTIISTFSLIAVAFPRAYVSSLTYRAKQKISKFEINSINERLKKNVFISSLVAILPAVIYGIWLKNNFVLICGLLTIAYVTISQLSSFNSLVAMMHVDGAWLAKWNVSISLFVGGYFLVIPAKDEKFFIFGLIMLSVLYAIRHRFLKIRIYERNIY